MDVPQYIPERGEIKLSYKEKGRSYDLSSSGRGLQQTLLLLSYMYANRGAVLLLDEPDAHLEILRQRQIYQLLVDVARENDNQIIAASHSEVLLNEAAERDVVVAFVGKPHRMDDRGSQVLKALREIGFEHYYQAEQTGWVLYLEGSTDLAILRALAEKIGHEDAIRVLDKPFVHYIRNQPQEVLRHFHGLREATPKLMGVAIFDRLEQEIPADKWRRMSGVATKRDRKLFVLPETLFEYAKATSQVDSIGPLFAAGEASRRMKAMEEAIEEVTRAMETFGKGSPWDVNTKVSDDFLDPLFRSYFRRLGLYNVMAKKNFHELAYFVPEDKIDPEVKEKLDALVKVANSAKPFENE